MENSPTWRRLRVGRKRFAVVGLAAIIIASGSYYFYTSSPGRASTQPAMTHQLRYDEVLLEGFEWGGGPNPGIWNVTGGWSGSNGPENPSSLYGCYQGIGCEWSGTGRHNESAQMVLNLSLARAWVNYTNLMLNFSLWVDTNTNDVMYVDYFNSGNWNLGSQYSGHISTTRPLNETFNGWFPVKLTVPTTTTMMRFRYATGCCETLYKGIFVDDLGVYMIGPGSYGKILVTGYAQDSAPLQIPVRVDGGPYFKTFAEPGFNAGINFLSSPGNHTLSVPSTFTDGSKLYQFVSWSDGANSTSRLVSVPSAFQFSATFMPAT